jgi:hypothetical protein
MKAPKLNQYMQPTDGFVVRRNFISALEQDLQFEYNPFSQPNVISKGTVNTTAGGVLTLYDSTGGTKILTYNPDTGVVTILGSLIANTVATGTYSNIILAGTPALSGTLSGGVHGTSLFKGGTIANSVIGTPALSGGTLNPSVYQTSGSVGIGTTIAYVKTVNYSGSVTTFGTLSFSNGLLVTSTS